MVPQGPPPPLGGGQPVPPSLFRSNSNLSQNSFQSLVSPRGNQFNNNNMNMLGNGNTPDPLSNGMGFNHPSSSYMSTSSGGPHPNSSGQQQFSNASGSSDQQQAQQQIDSHNLQHNQQYSLPGNSQQQQQQQQQFQAMRAGLGGVGPVKIEPQVSSEQMRNLGPVKLEPQQLQSMRILGQVKMEHSDPSMFLHHQQQQQQQHHQQQMMLSRQSSQAAAAAQILHQQRLMQMQHQQQQQQLLKSMPQQRGQFQQQNLPIRNPGKPVYEPGMCARRLTHYMYQQQHRPEDNNIEFWRKFVAEYFAPNAKKKWCVSMYGSGRQTTGVFPQDVWHCEICNRRPGRGFEATAEVLPRLFKIKYESGTLEELLYVDMPREYQNSSGQIVLDYAKAIQESVFDQLRVVRDGQLRLVFSPDLKICSWEFCARRHEELIPRRLLIPQVSQLGAAAQKCQVASQNSSSNISASELQNNCNMFVASARQLAKALEVPLVNDLGYTKRYVRCLQISEVVNSMKDLIDYSRETGTGPMESLTKFPRRTNTSPRFQGQPQQPQQQTTSQNQNSNNDNPSQTINNTMNSIPATTSSTNTNPALLHQNSINSRQPPNSPYGAANTVQITSPVSSNTVPQNQTSPSPFQSPTLSQPNSHVNNNSPNVSSQPTNDDDSQSSVQKIIHDMMMSSSQLGGGRMGNSDVKNSVNGSNSGFGNQSVMVNGIRPALGNNNNNNSMSMNGRANVNPQQQDLSNQLLSGLGAVNSFNNQLQFDWKGWKGSP